VLLCSVGDGLTGCGIDGTLGFVIYDSRPMPMVILDHYATRGEAENAREIASKIYARHLAA
jgi:hypothetical protein